MGANAIRRHPLTAYALGALAITWACWLPLVAAKVVVGPGGWPSHAPGLLGPALAAVLVTALVSGRPGLAQLGRALTRWRIGLGPWLFTATPILLFAATALVSPLLGGPPLSWTKLGIMNGFPVVSPVTLALMLVVLNGIGEETGWRGFAFAEFRRRHGVLVSGLLVAPIWALWHVPAFAVLETYRGLGPGALVGFVIGIACGSIVLGWLYEASGRSLLAVSLWHGTYNLFSATGAARGPLAAVETTAVILFAVGLGVQQARVTLRARRPATAG
jgi:membrane protease YdiL (CAAX protease family)